MNIPISKEDELKAEIMLGIEDLKNGKTRSFESKKEIFQAIKKRGQERLAKVKNQKNKLAE